MVTLQATRWRAPAWRTMGHWMARWPERSISVRSRRSITDSRAARPCAPAATYMFSSGMQLQPILYRMDGTAAGTRIVKDFSGISDSGRRWHHRQRRPFLRCGSSARDASTGGVMARRPARLPSRARKGSATGLFIANGKLYFLAIDFDTSLIEPWVSDGTGGRHPSDCAGPGCIAHRGNG